ncbi:hypothetical protein Y032_0732g1909 [Ancylostoma ceylanicum]|nr:hypothetical protein Y032_0732g1909 [Ancylostoma ceylanicum]
MLPFYSKVLALRQLPHSRPYAFGMVCHVGHTRFCTRHVKSWKLSAVSHWKRAKTCLASSNCRELPHFGSRPSGKICETDSNFFDDSDVMRFAGPLCVRC